MKTDVNRTKDNQYQITVSAEDVNLLLSAEELRDGCLAALIFLAEPPAKTKEDRDEAVQKIRSALRKARGRSPD